MSGYKYKQFFNPNNGASVCVFLILEVVICRSRLDLCCFNLKITFLCNCNEENAGLSLIKIFITSAEIPLSMRYFFLASCLLITISCRKSVKQEPAPIQDGIMKCKIDGQAFTFNSSLISFNSSMRAFFMQGLDSQLAVLEYPSNTPTRYPYVFPNVDSSGIYCHLVIRKIMGELQFDAYTYSSNSHNRKSSLNVTITQNEPHHVAGFLSGSMINMDEDKIARVTEGTFDFKF